MSKLLTVEDVFPARRGDVHVMPRFTTADAPAGPLRVSLRFSDGTSREVDAVVEAAHVRGPLPPYAMLRLRNVSVDEVSVGTEIWRV